MSNGNALRICVVYAMYATLLILGTLPCLAKPTDIAKKAEYSTMYERNYGVLVVFVHILEPARFYCGDVDSKGIAKGISLPGSLDTRFDFQQGDHHEPFNLNNKTYNLYQFKAKLGVCKGTVHGSECTDTVKRGDVIRRLCPICEANWRSK